MNSGARVEVSATVRSNMGQEENLRGPCPLRLFTARRPGPREGMTLSRATQTILLIALAQAMTRTLWLSTRVLHDLSPNGTHGIAHFTTKETRLEKSSHLPWVTQQLYARIKMKLGSGSQG